MQVSRRLMPGLIAAVVAAAAAPAEAQAAPKRLDFEEFLIKQKELHGERVQMHATFDAMKPKYAQAEFGADFFKGNGIAPDSHYLFAVTFKGQSRVWLFPVMDKKPEGAAIWARLKALEPGTKITLTGKLRRMGDTGKHQQDPNRRRYGGGWVEVPSVLDVEALATGWMKTLPEHVADLGRSDALAKETAPLVLRFGNSAVTPLVKALTDATAPHRQRVYAARILTELKPQSALAKISGVVRKSSNDEIRTEAFRAVLAIRPVSGLKLIGSLLRKREPDEWAQDGVATLLESGQVKLVELKRAAGRKWKEVAPGVAASLRKRARDALAAKEYARAAAAAGGSLILDDQAGEMYWIRGHGALQVPGISQEQREAAVADLLKALSMGAGKVAPLLQLTRETLAAKKPLAAETLSRRLFERRPTDASVKALRVEVLLHRAELALQAGDKPTAMALTIEALGLDPASEAAQLFKAKLEGKNLAMFGARALEIAGGRVKAPKAYVEDATLVRKGGKYRYEFAGVAGKFPKFGSETHRPLCIIVFTRVPDTVRFGANSVQDVLRKRITFYPDIPNDTEIHIFKSAAGGDIAYIVFPFTDKLDRKTRNFLFVRMVNGEYLMGDLTVDERLAEKQWKTAMEIIGTFEWVR